MAETPYVETEVLLALLNDNEDHAIELIGGMSDYERDGFRSYLLKAADFANNRNWCVGCRQFIECGSQRPWHPECLERRDRVVNDALRAVELRMQGRGGM